MKDPLQKIKVVAVLFIVLGAIAWSGFIWTFLSESALSFSLEMALLPAGYGLLRRREAWRRTSVAIVVVFLFAALAVPLIGYTISPTFTIFVQGYSIDPASPVAVLIVLGYAGIVLGCLFWMFRTLRNREVVDHFGNDSRTEHAGTA